MLAPSLDVFDDGIGVWDGIDVRRAIQREVEKVRDLPKAVFVAFLGKVDPLAALEELDFVDEAVTSHEKGTAVLSIAGAVDEKKLKKAVTDAGYKYLGIK